ncbi:hypothetical protein MPTK1_5g05980 [Marchantia polymorpha subsp. ruderalis]|uniref:Uncharacterized protein n=2 Tax=Marchantia polymorpha TaxID=3197 RepID=A0AAF6BFF2_MARPO|nr:hypothetical protein MARPO_0027s0029 [Marchantia polymorpha]BBN10736.1 hypothetical protein Mp_5g05980 [Marchantia polymorpha subsp. ruderalis]|eukprot:PTQ42897.1 hypothetical protein MARPO_0027s0029 [Marchantia polymorpha]
MKFLGSVFITRRGPRVRWNAFVDGPDVKPSTGSGSGGDFETIPGASSSTHGLLEKSELWTSSVGMDRTLRSHGDFTRPVARSLFYLKSSNSSSPLRESRLQ